MKPTELMPALPMVTDGWSFAAFVLATVWLRRRS